MADNDVTAINIDAMKMWLLDERAQLLHDLEVKEQQVAEDGDDLDPERGGVGNHMADDANVTVEQETMLTLERSVQKQLDHVGEALARIAEGTYGVCAHNTPPRSPARNTASVRRTQSALCHSA